MAIGVLGTRHLPVRDAVWLEPGQRIVLDAEGVSWNEVRLERLDALYVHGFRYEDPVLPPADPACDWSLWQVGAVIRQQTYSFLYSVLAHLEQRGGPRLYNPLSVEVAAFDRPGQLDRLARAGFAVPPLLTGNDDGPVAAFQIAVYDREAGGDKEKSGNGGQQQAANHGAAQRGVLLAAVAQAQSHGHHADDHG